MNFATPGNWLWLPPLMGGILALWMLRRRRQNVTVSSLILWQALLQDTQTNTPLQKLRRNLLLILQLIAAFLLVCALARPFVYGRGVTGRTLVVVIDNSASMAATDVRPTRLDAAKAAAKDFLTRQRSGSDVAAVLTAGARPETVVGLTGNAARLENGIDKIAPTDAPGGLPAALALASALTGGKSDSQIRVLTDGVGGTEAAARLAGIHFGGTEVRQTTIGSPAAQNVGITAMDGRHNPDTGRVEVFVAVRRFGTASPTGGTLSLFLNGKLIDARAIAFNGGTDAETFDSGLLANGGVVTARLDDVHDDLATDNQASLVLPPPLKRRILLVTSGNLFLEKGLSSDPDATLDECAPKQFATAGKNGVGYALVVLDGVLPPGPLPPGNFLIFHAANAQTPLTPLGGALSAPAFLDQNRAHPIMRFVDLTGLRVRAAPRMGFAPWATTLAEGIGGPWIAAGERDHRRMVSVAFDLADSNWPLSASFPIFLTNAVDWLTAESRPGCTAPETPAGQPFSVIVPPGQGVLSIVRPDGQASAVAAPPAGGVVSYGNTVQVGIYHVKTAGGADYPAAVDLLDATTSDLTPRNVVALDHVGRQTPPANIPLARRAHRDLWADIAAVALVVLLLEWVVYHRRMA